MAIYILTIVLYALYALWVFKRDYEPLDTEQDDMTARLAQVESEKALFMRQANLRWKETSPISQ